MHGVQANDSTRQGWSTPTNNHRKPIASPDLSDQDHIHHNDSDDARAHKRNRRKLGLGAKRVDNAHNASKLVGEYQLGQVIGKGFFGEVYMGVNVNSQLTVAVKQLDSRKVPKRYHDNVKDEIQALQTLDHPNVVDYNSVVVDEDAYIIMDYVDGGSVYDVVQKYGPLPEPLAGRYASQILEALVALHEQNIIHRNLKASNLLLKNGEIRLTDFGIAVKDDDKKFIVAGSPYWMAPEVLEMNSPTTSSADIWSLGCVVLEMYLGVPPYRDLPPMPALLQIIREGYTLPDGLPQDLHDFLSYCFQKDPKKRKDAKFLRAHSWIMKNENAKKDISEYPPRPLQQGMGEKSASKATLSIDLFTDKDKENIALAELLPSDTDDTMSPQEMLGKFRFHKSSSIPNRMNSSNVNELWNEIDVLRRVNDDNVALAVELKQLCEQLATDHQRLMELTYRQMKRAEAAEEQLRNVSRATAHSNMLLKRTNQLATDAVTKNNTISANIRKVEEHILEGDGVKKLATLLYKKLAADALCNVTIASFLSYSSNVKQWKEKRGWFAIKDNFLFHYKTEKASVPVDIIYLGDGTRLSPLSDDQFRRKHCFKVGEFLLLAADTPESCSEWMLALSNPNKWYESSDDVVKTRTKDDAEKEKKKRDERQMQHSASGNGTQYATSPQTMPRESTQVFGVPLDELFAREGGQVPSFYMSMINYLQESAVYEEGILRLSGSLSVINKMRDTLQSGEHVDFTKQDPHAVAGLLKCFFRELPEPIIPEPYHSTTLDIMSDSELSDEQRVYELKSTIEQLPPENCTVFQILMSFLTQVNAASDRNRMTVQNIVTCMVPTLKCVPGVVMYIIPNYDFFFPAVAAGEEEAHPAS